MTYEPADKYRAAVIERYADGTKWTHYFLTREDAERAMKEFRNPNRTYEIVEVNA